MIVMTQTGINMQSYNMRSLFQATRMEWVEKSGREWIITLDAGYINVNNEYQFSDFERGRVLQQAGGCYSYRFLNRSS